MNTRSFLCVFKLFEIYMWIVILTLIAHLPEFQSNCCMAVFIGRRILNMNSLLFFPPSKPLTFHLYTTTSDRFFRELFKDLRLNLFPNISTVKYPLRIIKLNLLNLTVLITVASNVKLDGCVFNGKSSWLLTAGIFTLLHSYIVSN